MFTEVQFAKCCASLNSDEIYEFVNDIVPQWLRDDIIESYAVEGDPEPTRSALNALGVKYNVQSLKDY